uniref:Uncharacterized protein n=1 Tax=Cannabis sativa TaxID=3483 RepID=A0A803NKK8_CANSA
MELAAGLKEMSPLWSDLHLKPGYTMNDFLDRADGFIKYEKVISLVKDSKNKKKKSTYCPAPNPDTQGAVEKEERTGKRDKTMVVYMPTSLSIVKHLVQTNSGANGFVLKRPGALRPAHAACSVDNYESTRLRLVFGACSESLPHKVDSEAVNFAGDSSDTRWFYKKGDHEYAVLRFMGPLSGYQPKSHIGRISKIFLEYKCLSYSIGMRNFEKVPKNNILRA